MKKAAPVKKTVKKTVPKPPVLKPHNDHLISSGKAAEFTAKLNLDASNRTDKEKRPDEHNVSKLYLDPYNPRLAEYSHTGTQASLLKALEKDFDLQPLIDSMYRSGFFWEEPLVAIHEKIAESKKTELIVIEGNRRLAALKTLLANPEKYPIKEQRERLNRVPVIVRDDRAETLAFVGFRHITGVLQWEAPAKAQYAHDLIKSGSTLDELAQLIGDKTRDIARWVRTQSLVVHANELGLEQDDAEKKFYFSYLLTSTDAPATKRWLDLKIEPKTGLVSDVDPEKLKKLWVWLYGSKGNEVSPVVPESRQIHRLNRVIGNARAVKELEKTNNLDRAFVETQDPATYVVETLGSVRSLLQDLVAVTAGQGTLEQMTIDPQQIADAKKEYFRVANILEDAKNKLGL
jgi:hypothetical protein